MIARGIGGAVRLAKELSMTEFRHQPSATYVAAVNALMKLPLDERTRAYADAAAPDLRKIADEQGGKKLSGRKSWRRLLGQKARDGDGLPGDDHVEVREGKGGLIYTSHPYALSFENLKEIVSHCIANGLEVNISSRSWYFPGATIQVTYTTRNDGP
jgi:hypothetical protein